MVLGEEGSHDPEGRPKGGYVVVENGIAAYREDTKGAPVMTLPAFDSHTTLSKFIY